MQAGGWAGGRSRQENEGDWGTMCPPASWSLIADWYTDCHWCTVQKTMGRTGWLQKRKQWKSHWPVCVCVRVRFVYVLYVCSVHYSQHGSEHHQQLLRVHPKDLTSICTYYEGQLYRFVFLSLLLPSFLLLSVQFRFPLFCFFSMTYWGDIIDWAVKFM